MTKKKKCFLDSLRNYKPSAMEEPFLKELVDYVANDDECFERKHVDGAKHIAASVFLVNQNDEILFLWHSKIQQWVQPGGHCDGNDNIIEVALTELEEETGLKATEVSTDPLEIRKYEYAKEVFGYRKSVYNIMYVAHVDTNIQEPRICEPDKCERMEWMTVDKAIEELSKSPYPYPTHAIEKYKRRSLQD